MQLEYGLDQRVPFLKAAVLGLQWAAILISSVVILGKVLGALHFDDAPAQVVYLQKLLFLSALTIVCQILWGHRLPLVSGPAAVLLIGVIGSRGFGISSIYTSVAIGGAFVAALAAGGLFRHVQKLFTPNVVAVVLLLIAFTLAPAIQNLLIARASGMNPIHNMGFGLALLFLMFVFYRMLGGIWRSTLIIWAMIAGSLLYAWIFPDARSENLFAHAPWFGGFFREMNLQPSLQPGVLVSFLFCFIALSINDLGSIQSVMEMLGPTDRERRVRRGIVITGLANIASGFLGVIGPVNYSLSPGVIASTGCASRFSLVPAAAFILITAFFPAATGLVGSVPSVVIGAILAFVMASQVGAGLTMALGGAEGAGFRFENGLVIGMPLLVGTVVAFSPDYLLDQLPRFLRPILGNGFVVGVASAMILDPIVAGRPGRPRSRDR